MNRLARWAAAVNEWLKGEEAKVVAAAEIALPVPPLVLDVDAAAYTHPPDEQFQPGPEARP